MGWIAFAGTMMLMLGSFHVIQGLVAVFQDEYFLVGKSGLTISVDYTTWGWTHIIGGILIAAAGLALFTGALWARVVGIALAMVSAVVNIGFLAAYPVWSTIMIADRRPRHLGADGARRRAEGRVVGRCAQPAIESPTRWRSLHVRGSVLPGSSTGDEALPTSGTPDWSGSVDDE